MYTQQLAHCPPHRLASHSHSLAYTQLITTHTTRDNYICDHSFQEIPSASHPPNDVSIQIPQHMNYRSIHIFHSQLSRLKILLGGETNSIRNLWRCFPPSSDIWVEMADQFIHEPCSCYNRNEGWYLPYVLRMITATSLFSTGFSI